MASARHPPIDSPSFRSSEPISRPYSGHRNPPRADPPPATGTAGFQPAPFRLPAFNSRLSPTIGPPQIPRLEPGRILAVVCRHFGVEPGEECRRRRGSWVRAVGARMLSRFAGLTQRDIAKRFVVGTGKAVSAHLQRLSSAVSADKTPQRRIQSVEKELVEVQNAVKY